MFLSSLLLIANNAFGADEKSLVDAMANARKHCSGISEQLNDIKKLAGVGTAVSAVGTAVGGGATAVGVVKTGTDEELDDIRKEIERIKAATPRPNPLPADTNPGQLQQELEQYARQQLSVSEDNVDGTTTNLADLEKQQKELEEKSKKLGDARTGLMATATATNIAGAVISGINQVKTDLITQIGACAGAIQTLSYMKTQASLDGSATDEEIAHADKVISACNKYNLEDVKKINARATGATVSSGIGAATGLAGTITSGIANTDQTRENAEKAKNLNTASNVLAGVTTAASLTSTVFNATQISAAKRVIETAEQCEEALK